ncbi:MAG: hypoxanthine-guanine phosphoribosyltransferase, partial [Gammaproteobacteria bacterium]|nr:hypoxanthine-guanine phosphoribosyltransferase [Gammaproteobacteria bacterium]
MPANLEHIQQIMAEADTLFSTEEVEAAIDRVAEQINQKLFDSNPVVFCVMNGGLIFSGKLLTKLTFPLEQSYLHASRYRNETSGGELFWKAKPEVSFMDREVLIIDDILDEGHTLTAI